MLDNDLFLVSVDADKEIALFEIELVSKEFIQKKGRIRTFDQFYTNKVALLDRCSCFRIYLANDGSEGESKDVKVFFTQNFLVVATLETIEWKNYKELSTSEPFGKHKIPFNLFNPTILEQGF